MLFFESKWDRSLVPDVISPGPVDGLKNLNGVWKLKRFCITYTELIFKFLSR